MSFLSRRFSLALYAGFALAQPALAADPAACQYLEAARVQLAYTGPGLEITMPGTINGKPARMLADTGSGRTYLTRTAVQRHGLRLRPTSERVHGIGGETMVYASKVSDFAAGPARSTSATMPVPADTGSVPSFDAIVGAPYLLQTDLELALGSKEARFFRPVNCDKAYLAYWDRQANVIPFARNASTGNPVIQIQLNGVTLDAIIDSGASASSVDLRAARRAGIDVNAPGAIRLGNSTGIGSREVASWAVTAESFVIGDEKIHNPKLNVIDTGGRLDVDMLLGADFLRSHRVLFAMSQRKLYLSYTGGTPFSPRTGIEPWMQAEAEAGNPDAQFALAKLHLLGRAVARDTAAAAAWLDKAAKAGQPHANLVLGRRLLLAGQAAEAAERLQGALAQLPLERRGELWLYLARLNGGDPAQARQALAARARFDGEGWPYPVAEYFLGKIEADALLAQAITPAQTCEAKQFVALHAAPGAQAATPAGCPAGRVAEAVFMLELH